MLVLFDHTKHYTKMIDQSFIQLIFARIEQITIIHLLPEMLVIQ